MTLFTRDLLAQGLQEHEIRGQVRRGTLIRVRHGVYVRADDGVAVADAALAGGLTVDEVSAVLHGMRRPGNPQAREVLRFADARSESVGESHSRWLLAELNLPAPELQHEFRDSAGNFVARVDFWWPDFGLIGEFDGQGKYLRPAKPGRTVQQVVLTEKRREEALRRLGWWVVRWGWSELDDRAAFKELISAGLAFAARTRRGGA